MVNKKLNNFQAAAIAMATKQKQTNLVSAKIALAGVVEREKAQRIKEEEAVRAKAKASRSMTSNKYAWKSKPMKFGALGAKYSTSINYPVFAVGGGGGGATAAEVNRFMNLAIDQMQKKNDPIIMQNPAYEELVKRYGAVPDKIITDDYGAF